VHVFVLPLGSNSARGVSLWNVAAPAQFVNSAWNVEARIFTMFHEIGHLVMRTSSACVGYVNAREDVQRSIERWCDGTVYLPSGMDAQDFAVASASSSSSLRRQ